MLRMVALLVPGATTVTPHGRYYGTLLRWLVDMGGQQNRLPVSRRQFGYGCHRPCQAEAIRDNRARVSASGFVWEPHRESRRLCL